MIAYWAPGGGYGHATRAAAICRHLADVTVYRDRSECNEPLDHHGIEVVVAPELPVEARDADLVVWDAPPAGAPFDAVCVWRYGRELSRQSTFSIEHHTPHEIPQFWPVISLGPKEIHSRAEARRRLLANKREKLTVVVSSARWPHRIESAFRSVPSPRFITTWPALPDLRGADVVAGAAGANLFGEVHHLGLDHRWAAACPDQKARLAVPPPDPARRWPDQSAAAAEYLTEFFG